MKTQRLKLTRPAIRSRAEMENLVGEIADLTLQQRALTNTLDTQIKAARERFEEPLAALAKSLDEKMAVAQDWAEANPADFGKLKSVEMVHGTVGWRTGQPALKTLAGWTWDRVLEKLKTLPAMLDFIRLKEEVNKAAILDARESLTPDALRALGVRVVQEEAFFVEPKLTPQVERISA